jgi:hypothetical protein
MKFKFVFLSLLLLAQFVAAQVPQGIPYQAAARNANGQPLVNTNVQVRFSIIDSISTGAIVYQETHSLTTNNTGIFNANIGMGTSVSGTFNTINWGKNSKFMQVELDPTGAGSTYLDLGTQQMLSVPYALYAAQSGSMLGAQTSSGAFSHYIGEVWGGGVIYDLYKGSDGQEHGYIVSLYNLSTGVEWSNITSSYIGASAQSLTDGLSNSNAIVSQVGHTNSAAKLCLDYVYNGYNDWYLPASEELIILSHSTVTINRALSIVGGNLLSDTYWSSTEYVYASPAVKIVGLYSGASVNYTVKNYSWSVYPVRAIRTF